MAGLLDMVPWWPTPARMGEDRRWHPVDQSPPAPFSNVLGLLGTIAPGGTGAFGKSAMLLGARVPLPAGAAKKGVETLTQKGVSDSIPVSSGGGPPPPGSVPSGSPQPLLNYPKTGPGKPMINERGKPYFEKVHTPEEAALKKRLHATQRDIKAGHYKPYFDVSKRYDVDVSKYPAGKTTLKEAVPRTAKSIEKYENLIKELGPEMKKRLRAVFKKGDKIPNSEDWYFMGQLEKEFIGELGEEAGRARFKYQFADSMAATTGGADPTSNFRMAMYGNYLEANKLPFPEHGYQMPHPIGGRYVGGNMAQRKKMAETNQAGTWTGFEPRKNPKRHNFSRDFIGDEMAATIDEQMSTAMVPGMKLPPGPSYGLYEGVMHQVAKQQGVAPRGFQDVAWAGAKGMDEGKPMIQVTNESIERTARETGLTPKEVVIQGIIHSRIPMYGTAGLLGMGAMNEAMNTEAPGA